MTARAHGYARYRLNGCRCYVCAFAVSQYEQQRQKAITAGTWQPFVDAAPIRAHLQTLSAAGVGYKQAARLAGLGTSTVGSILYGRRGNPPCAKVRRETAERLLAIQPPPAGDPAGLAGRALVDASGTRRRIQAMCVVGWSLGAQARRVGWTTANYAGLLTAARVTAATARTVTALYDRLAMTPAPAGSSATSARRWAARQGFLPPLCWDDDCIDDPHAQPQLGLLADGEDADEAVVWLALQGMLGLDELPPAERAVVQRHLDERRAAGQAPRGAEIADVYLRLRGQHGYGREQAARHLGIPVMTLHQALSRARRAGDTRIDYGRPDRTDLRPHAEVHEAVS